LVETALDRYLRPLWGLNAFGFELDDFGLHRACDRSVVARFAVERGTVDVDQSRSVSFSE